MSKAHQRQAMIGPDRDPERELQDLLEAMVYGVTGSSPATVACAKGHGFMHFEIRCTREAHLALSNGRDHIYTVLKTAGAVRRIRISIQFHEQAVHETRPADTRSPNDVLEDLVLKMAKSFADWPEDVVVFPAHGDGFSHYNISCDTRDAGALIGSRASHANAMRGVLSAVGRTLGVRASLQIAARDGDG